MSPAAARGRGGGVSEAATHRLSLLLRGLRRLHEEGVGTVSSFRLAQRFGMNAAQIRKDLADGGEFGVRGVGYDVADLLRRLGAILGLDTLKRRDSSRSPATTRTKLPREDPSAGCGPSPGADERAEGNNDCRLPLADCPARRAIKVNARQFDSRTLPCTGITQTTFCFR